MIAANADTGASMAGSTSVAKPLIKTIFVGSSTADKEIALRVASCLSEMEGVRAKCWVEEFPLGLLTFEALERMLRSCAGAVLIVTNEDKCRQPNNNVMIELGLVAGRMGRMRVALCTRKDAQLPSDLAAFTRIENLLVTPEEAEKNQNADELSADAINRLEQWTKLLLAMPEGMPCTQVLHGYTGRWRVVLEFKRWRGRSFDFAGMNGEIVIQIPLDGLGGFGILTGRVTLSWKGDAKSNKPYTGIFHVCSSINDVTCRPDGSMTLRTQTLMRHPVLENGDRPVDAILPEELAAPWIFRWDLKPYEHDTALMNVELHTDVHNEWTEGTGAAYRESLNSL
jgi:hypothetical protein